MEVCTPEHSHVCGLATYFMSNLLDIDPSRLHIRMNHLFEVQRRAATKVDLEDGYSTEFVAGVDQAFLGDLIISGAVVLGTSLDVIGRASCTMQAAFPYISGLLSFREGPVAIRAVKKLKPKPTLLFVDACGINHPRMAGMASFIGVVLDLPTIGITKNVLCGEGELPEKAGNVAPLFYKGEQVGHLLKSRDGCRPIVIAPGHRVSMRSSLELTIKYLVNSKLPEPCRLAHQYANQVKREMHYPTSRM
jgi:deoxyribonuclease V